MSTKTEIIESVVKESFVSIVAKSFDAWITDKKFLNLETKQRTDFSSLPEKQQQKIREEYDKYISDERDKERVKRKQKPWDRLLGETGKPWTIAYLRQWGKQVARDARADGMEVNDTFAFETAQGAISQYPGLRAYLKSKNIPEKAMVSAVADFIV
jgi:phenylacetate-coenzyme A ligase PaaK-like adenylate-forming protein